jgi:hypothetical protein
MCLLSSWTPNKASGQPSAHLQKIPTTGSSWHQGSACLACNEYSTPHTVLNLVTVQHLQENIQVAAGLAGEERSDLIDCQVDQASMDSGDLTDHEGTLSKQGRQVSTKKHFRYVGKKDVGDKRPAITPMHILGLAKLSQVCGNPARMSMPSWLCPNFSRNAGITQSCRWEQG